MDDIRPQYCRSRINKISRLETTKKDETHGSDGSVEGPKDRGQGSRIGGNHDITRITRDLTGSHRLYVYFEGQIGIPTSAALRQSSVGFGLFFSPRD